MAKRKIYTVGELIRELKKHAAIRGDDEPVCLVYPRVGEWGPMGANKSLVGHVRYRKNDIAGVQIVVYEPEFYG